MMAMPAAACERVPLGAPAAGAMLADARPTLRWQALPGVTRYRVQILTRLAEGAVSAHFDTLVSGTAFEPPHALAERAAAVQVLVTEAGCRQADIGAEPVAFFVDPALACPAPASLAVTRSGAQRELAWAAVEAALEYEVAVFDRQGRTLSRTLAKSTAATLDPPAGAVLGVRALCRGGAGRYAWLVP